jgi:hypothetical protein
MFVYRFWVLLSRDRGEFWIRVMVGGAVDEKRIEAAVRRLPVLPERSAELSRAVTGLLYVVRKAASKDEILPPPEPAGKSPAEEVDMERLAAAKELRETHWHVHDFKEAWPDIPPVARDTLDRRLRAAGISNVEDLIEGLTRLADAMAAAADDLERPDRPLPAPVEAPKADDPPLLIAQHAARMYKRLTGKKLPKPNGKGVLPRGPFYWLLEDVFAAAGLLASVDQYAKTVARS